jgi:hypothetical protein
MSIAKTKEAIESTPDNDEIGIPTAWFALDNRHVETTKLKALAASHTRLLEAAKGVLADSSTAFECSTEEELEAAIEEAEK